MKRVRFRTENGAFIAGRRNLNNAIHELKKEGGEWCAKFTKWSGDKTWEQIKAVKGVLIPALSEYTGETIKEVQRRVKLDYGEVEYFEMNGERYVEIKSFANYTKREMRSFMEKLLNHMEHDCGMVFDLKKKKRWLLDEDTGELTEIAT